MLFNKLTKLGYSIIKTSALEELKNELDLAKLHLLRQQQVTNHVTEQRNKFRNLWLDASAENDKKPDT